MAPLFVLLGGASLALVVSAAVPGWSVRRHWPAAIRVGLAAMFTVTGTGQPTRWLLPRGTA